MPKSKKIHSTISCLSMIYFLLSESFCCFKSSLRRLAYIVFALLLWSLVHPMHNLTTLQLKVETSRGSPHFWQ